MWEFSCVEEYYIVFHKGKIFFVKSAVLSRNEINLIQILLDESKNSFTPFICNNKSGSLCFYLFFQVSFIYQSMKKMKSTYGSKEIKFRRLSHLAAVKVNLWVLLAFRILKAVICSQRIWGIWKQPSITSIESNMWPSLIPLFYSMPTQMANQCTLCKGWKFFFLIGLSATGLLIKTSTVTFTSNMDSFTKYLFSKYFLKNIESL